MPAQTKAKNKSAPKSAGRRRTKIATYYEARYPERKLRRMYKKGGASVKQLRAWADAYKTPGGASGIGALVKLSKELRISLQ